MTSIWPHPECPRYSFGGLISHKAEYERLMLSPMTLSQARAGLRVAFSRRVDAHTRSQPPPRRCVSCGNTPQTRMRTHRCAERAACSSPGPQHQPAWPPPLPTCARRRGSASGILPTPKVRVPAAQAHHTHARPGKSTRERRPRTRDAENLLESSHLGFATGTRLFHCIHIHEAR